MPINEKSPIHEKDPGGEELSEREKREANLDEMRSKGEEGYEKIMDEMYSEVRERVEEVLSKKGTLDSGDIELTPNEIDVIETMLGEKYSDEESIEDEVDGEIWRICKQKRKEILEEAEWPKEEH